MYTELKEVLFRRTIKAAIRSEDEDACRWPIFIAVTKESNGYAVWHSSEEVRIIAFSADRDAAIKYAARVDHEEAQDYARETVCNYRLIQSHLPEENEART